MANASIIAQKEQLVSEIAEKLQKAQSVIVFDYRGLTVAEVTALRAEMRKAGNEYVVVKNSMVERACEKIGLDESVKEMLKGPSAFAIGYDDAVSPAKVLKDTVKKLKKCEIKGGIVNGKVTDAAGIDALAQGGSHCPHARQHDEPHQRSCDRSRSDRQEERRRDRRSSRRIISA